MKNKINDTLEKIGLTNAEIQVYTTLLKLGEAKVGEIIKLVQVSASNVHDACEKLIQKGIISYILKNNIKHYFPVEPENLNLIIEKQEEELKNKKTELNKILPEIKAIKKIVEQKQNAEVFLGILGIKSAFKKLFEHEFRGQEYIFFYKYDELNVEIVHTFFTKMDIEDYYKNLPTKGLFSLDYKNLFNERKNKNKIKAKFTNHPIPSSVNIYGDKTLIIAWSDNPIAFLIQSKEVTQTYEELFEEIWEKTS